MTLDTLIDIVGVEDSVILVGDESGLYSEIYLTESTYYGSECVNLMFSVNQKYLMEKVDYF